MSYSHSRKPDLPVTHSSPLCTSLSTPSVHHCNCPTPIIACVLYCKHQIIYEFSLSYFSWLPDDSVSGCGVKPWPAASCACCLQNTLEMCGAWPGTLVTWLRLSLSMINCFALRLLSQICVTCRSCWFPVSVVLSCVKARCLGPVGWLHTYEMVTECECGRCEMLVFMVCGVRQNLLTK